jgi:hypothetical protein
VEKYEKIIRAKQENRKPTDAIKIVTIQDKKCVLLFQDMFPTNAKYIKQTGKMSTPKIKEFL